MKKDKKDTILIYTDAINMAVYRGLEYSELGELMLALFEYNNGKEKNESDFSSEDLYDLYIEYKNKVDDNYKKYQSKKERNERYQSKKKVENATNTDKTEVIEEPIITVKKEPNNKSNSNRLYDYDTPHSDHINNTIERNKSNLSLSTVRSDIIKEIEKDGWTEEQSNSIYEEIIMKCKR